MESPERDQTALVVLVPEAESLVGEFRRKFDISAMQGLGAHVTILFPFKPPEQLSVDVLADLRALFAAQPRFKFSLSSVDGFPSVVFLAPEPAAPFERLTRATAARYPDCPPYGGAFTETIPHLTVAQRPPAENLDQVADRVRSSIEPLLPVACSADEVSLAVRRTNRWSIAERFHLHRGSDAVRTRR